VYSFYESFIYYWLRVIYVYIMSNRKIYRTISIQSDIADRIDEIVGSNVGFVSSTEFVRDAIRRRLEQLEKKEEHK
jgi:metal-responsive CopG/Arc/MetJ family transcriptional regulator